MKVCRSCQHEMDDNALFCPQCGVKVSSFPEEIQTDAACVESTEAIPTITESAMEIVPLAETDKKKGKKHFIGIAIAVVVILAIICAFLFANPSKHSPEPIIGTYKFYGMLSNGKFTSVDGFFGVLTGSLNAKSDHTVSMELSLIGNYTGTWTRYNLENKVLSDSYLLELNHPTLPSQSVAAAFANDDYPAFQNLLMVYWTDQMYLLFEPV